MSIAEKLTTVAQNQQKVYNAGYEKGKAEGGDAEAAYNEGHADGKQAEYDRFWDSFQENGNRKSYRYAFAGAAWTEAILNPKYPIKIVDTTTNSRRCAYMFTYLSIGGTEPFDMAALCAKIDFSEALSIQGLFQNAKANNITVNASKAISCRGAFGAGDGGSLNNITLTVSDACTDFYNTFINASRLTDLTITEGSVIAAAIDLKHCPLTKASIESVMQALSGKTTGLTASFKKTAVNAAYTEDEWNAKIAGSNWSFTLT